MTLRARHTEEQQIVESDRRQPADIAGIDANADQSRGSEAEAGDKEDEKELHNYCKSALLIYTCSCTLTVVFGASALPQTVLWTLKNQRPPPKALRAPRVDRATKKESA